MEFLLCNVGKLAHIIIFLLFFSLPVLYTTVPSAISSATVQVDEVGDIVTWQPPPQPNGVIQNYNIRISRVVQGVTERSYDFSTLELSAGTYMIQVSSQLCFAVYKSQKSFPNETSACRDGTLKACLYYHSRNNGYTFPA